MAEFPPLPDTISGTILESKIREGPGVVVMRGRDTLGLPVDMHLFPAALVGARIPHSLFFDEVRASAALHHERLATVVNAGEKGPWLFVACKGTDGATLAHLFGRGHLDEERALGIFAAACEGLAVLEKAGLRHGGLDPRAISLPGAGQVLLSLRRLVPLDLAARDASYLAPEEAKGQDWGIASDLYALGLMLYEALLGRPVIEGPPEEVRVRIARGEVPSPAMTLKGVLPQTVDLLGALLSPDPRARPGSAAETVRRLRALQSAFSATESLEGSLEAPIAAVPIPAPIAVAPPPPSRAAPPRIAAPTPVPAAPAAPPPPAAAGTPSLRGRRAHARLVLPWGGQEQIHELVDPVTWVGVETDGRIAARPEEFPGAVARVEIGSTSDFLVATGVAPRPQVEGREVQRHELRLGSEIRIGGHAVQFEKAERLVPEGGGATDQERRHRVKRSRPWRAPVATACVVGAIALGWGVYRWQQGVSARMGRLEESRDVLRKAEIQYARMPAPPPAPTTQEIAAREDTAMRLLDAARRERQAGRTREAIQRLETLVRTQGSTAAALLAAEDLRELRGSVRLPGAEALREAQGKSDQLLAEGKVAEAQAVLIEFAQAHPASFVGDRAKQAAEAIARVAEDRVDELLRVARAAADRRDWQAAMSAAERAVSAAATPDARTRAEKAREGIQAMLPRAGGDASPLDRARPTPGSGPKPNTGPDPRPPTNGGVKPPTPPPTAGPDEEASALFRSSRTALEQGRFGEAERGFYRLLTEFKDAKIVRDYGQEVALRYLDAVKKGHGVAGLFRAPATFRGNRVQLRWTFEDPLEAEDFENVSMFAVPTRANFNLRDGELAADGAGAFMLRACFRTESVTMSFRIRPGLPAQDMGAMMAEPKELANHLLFTLGNAYFKLDKGANTYAAPGHLIFVFGKGMWARGDADQIGFVRTGFSEEPKLKPREWIGIECAKERDKAKFVVGDKVIQGRAIGDNKYEITGVRPALFVLLSEARFDDLTVEGEIDPAWALSERARLFPEPK